MISERKKRIAEFLSALVFVFLFAEISYAVSVGHATLRNTQSNHALHPDGWLEPTYSALLSDIQYAWCGDQGAVTGTGPVQKFFFDCSSNQWIPYVSQAPFTPVFTPTFTPTGTLSPTLTPTPMGSPTPTNTPPTSLVTGLGTYSQDIHEWSSTSVKEFPYSAKFDGVTDDSGALNACILANSSVVLPAGTCLLAGPVTLKSGLRMTGQGMKATQFVLSGPTAGFVSDPNNIYMSQVILDAFSVTGNASTGNAFDFSNTSNEVYECSFSNLSIICGGRALYNPREFNNAYFNLQMSSWTNNVFEVAGGNTCSYKNLYVHNVPTNFFGYRLYNGGVLDSCNGMDTGGGSWGCFGQRIADGDPTNTQYQCLFNRCNLEAWNNYGAWLRYTGTALFNDCFFLPANGVTYTSSVYATDTSDIEFHGGVFNSCSGCTRTKLAEIACGSCAGPIISYGNNGVSQVDESGYAQTIQTLRTDNPAFITNSLLINYLSTLGLWVKGSASVTGTMAATSYSSGLTPTPGFSGPITVVPFPVASPVVLHFNGGILSVSTPAP